MQGRITCTNFVWILVWSVSRERMPSSRTVNSPRYVQPWPLSFISSPPPDWHWIIHQHFLKWFGSVSQRLVSIPVSNILRYLTLRGSDFVSSGGSGRDYIIVSWMGLPITQSSFSWLLFWEPWYRDERIPDGPFSTFSLRLVSFLPRSFRWSFQSWGTAQQISSSTSILPIFSLTLPSFLLFGGWPWLYGL
jgi:hypothetical protein